MDAQDIEREVLNLLAQLKLGESMGLPGRGGWMMRVTACDTGFDFTHRNPTEEGRSKFFEYSTAGNSYGAGKIVQEPSLGVACRQCGVEMDGAIVGAIVLGVDDKVVGRFSWSNIVFAKGQTFSISAEGELVVNGASQGFLHALFLPDKNRLDGYVGVFKTTKPTEAVKVLEMETLLFASL